MRPPTRRGPAPAGRPHVSSASQNAATDDHGTRLTAAEADLERAVVNAALWGDQAADLVPELRAAVSAIADPWCAAVVSAIADVLQHPDIQTLAQTPHTRDSALGAVAMAAHEHLVAQGVDDFGALVLADVPPGTLNALPYLLGRLDEAAQRRHVLARLVAMADALERPGGPAKVAELLGMAS